MRRATARLLIALSVLLSLVAIFLVGQAWRSADHQLPPDMQVIANPEALDSYITRETAMQVADNFRGDPIVEVPTGIFVQSVAFSASTDIHLTGYIWQKYPMNFPYSRGFRFAEEVLADDTEIEVAYTGTVMVDGVPHELIGSSFDVTVRQSFNYARYPLDFLTIWLRIWPADWERNTNILLVPDFDGYADLSKDVFGLDGDLVQGEWTIERTFFSYQRIPYDTNFGLSPKAEPMLYDEFFFNLAASRKFINAFIISLVPLLVISLLLFSTLMTISCDREQAERFGFNTTGVLGTCSGLFFLVLLSHIQVRSLFPGSGLVYIEYFYLVLYVMILLVALNGYLFSVGRLEKSSLLHWGDNFIAKVAFWPFLLWSLVLISWQTL